MKRDIESTALPSIEEMKKYQEGTLDETRVREIEMMSLTDPFLADALEGYSEIPAFDHVPPARSVQSGGTPWWHLGGWIGGLAVGGVLAWVIFGSGEQMGLAPSAIETHQEERDSSDASAGQDQPIATPSLWQNLSVEDRKDLETKNLEQKRGAEESVSDQREPKRDSVEVRFVAMRGQGQDFSLSSVKPTDPLVIKTRRSMINDFIRIGYYHVADYSLLRKNAKSAGTENNRHVPANQESRTSESLMEDLSSTQGYFEFLKQTLDHLTVKDFENAEAGFRLVLVNYPDDVNGQFYLGLTLFQSGSFDQSIQYFNEARNNALSTFDEDSAYYMARAMDLSGMKEEAVKAYQAIVSGGGFYADQARSFLDH